MSKHKKIRCCKRAIFFFRVVWSNRASQTHKIHICARASANQGATHKLLVFRKRKRWIKKSNNNDDETIRETMWHRHIIFTCQSVWLSIQCISFNFLPGIRFSKTSNVTMSPSFIFITTYLLNIHFNQMNRRPSIEIKWMSEPASNNFNICNMKMKRMEIKVKHCLFLSLCVLFFNTPNAIYCYMEVHASI